MGGIFTEFGLCNKARGQIFTPYNIAKLMAEIQCENLAEQITKKGFVTVHDCCCGAGALLIALANAARTQGVNYQRNMIFVAQDIDFTAAMMAYVQLSLLGCRGSVTVENSLAPHPPAAENIWKLPMNAIQKLPEGLL